jgi:nitrite reductase (NADH) large subunit
MASRTLWRTVCALNEILPDMGVAARLGQEQVAIFRVGESEEVYALGNRDPFSNANVISRGILGDLGGELVVASPVYKQHFRLRTGECVEDPQIALPAYPGRVYNGAVQLGTAIERVGATARPQLVMIGNGMAGMRVIEELLRIAPDMYDITVFGAEPRGNYNRILLSPVLAGEKSLDEIMLHPREWYEANGVTLHSGDPVVAIDRRQRLVRSKSGCEVQYDRLLLATGSRPFIIPVPGTQLEGVISFRDIEDVEAMKRAALSHKRAVVIGGGLLGLEAANGLLRQGMDVTVVHLTDKLMQRQLDGPAAELLKLTLERRGLKILLNADTRALLGERRVSSVQLKDGSEIPADLVVMAIGIRPNIELAKQAGLLCERGVVVNDTMQTYDPRVYAVGECVQHRKTTYGLVQPLYEQARVCAAHLAGAGHIGYPGSLVYTSLKVSGIELFSAGEFNGGPGCEDLVARDPAGGIYKRLVLRDNRLVGALLFGDARDSAWYLELMKEGRDVSALRERLLFGQAFAAPEGGIAAAA